MRVVFLSQIVPYPPHGGVLQRGYNLLRELGRRATVDLLAFVHPDAMPGEDALAESRRALGQFCERVEYFRLWPKASRAHRVAALALGALSREPFGAIAHRSAAYQQRVDELVRSEGVDVVHVDTIALSQFVLPRCDRPTVLTHHNVESMLMQRRAEVEEGRLARRYIAREAAKLRAYERTISPRFSVNVVVSEADGQALVDRVGPLRTAVVPNGVDTEYFTPGDGEEEPALVYTGGMNMFANRDAVLHFVNDVWPRVALEAPDARFYAVGQDPPPELLVLAKRDPRIVVTGYVDDIRPIVRRAAVYVVPLRVGGGTRLKVLDAMAMGKALVSTSIGCEGIAAKAGAHLEIADTADTFARSVLALLGDRSRRQALGHEARRLVERQYSWPVIGGQLLDAYREAMTVERRAR